METRFEIRDTGRDIGKGLYATSHIPAGSFIVEYTGKKIPTKIADEMTEARFLFEIDSDWTIDGEDESNIARYINHSCDPNAESEIHDGHILVSAIKDIEPHDEITMDYGLEYYDEFIRPVGCKCRAKKHH